MITGGTPEETKLSPPCTMLRDNAAFAASADRGRVADPAPRRRPWVPKDDLMLLAVLSTEFGRHLLDGSVGHARNATAPEGFFRLSGLPGRQFLVAGACPKCPRCRAKPRRPVPNALHRDESLFLLLRRVPWGWR